MAVLMITYDTEMFGREFQALHGWLGDRVDDHTITDRWLDQAQEVHGRTGAPCTSYVVGKLIEQHSAGFAALARNPLFNLESQLYCLRFFVDEGLVPQPPTEAQLTAAWGIELVDEVLAEIGRVPES